MHDVHLHNLDLNLLVALDALLRERHVTRAAARIGLSQSAMSHALARLRELFDDPLLIRTPGGMQPSERALAFAAPLRSGLEQLERALMPADEFDPRTTRRSFRLGVSDYEEIMLVLPLLKELRRRAPHVDLRLQTPRSLAAVPELLASGDFDLVIKPLMDADQVDGIYHQRIVADEVFVVVARRGNPYVGKKLTLKRYAAAPHVLFAPGGTPRGVVDDLLEARGLARRVLVSLPHLLPALHFVAETDLVLTLAKRVAQMYAPQLDLEIHPVPLETSPIELHQLWHERAHADPAHRFMRGVIRDVARDAARSGDPPARPSA